MKIFLISPNKEAIITKELEKKLQEVGDVYFYAKTGNLSDVKDLFEGKEPRILALDPDFCDWKADVEVIAKIPNLKAVCLQTTSFSWIDVDHLGKKGIAVVNLRGFSMEAVAEWALLVALSLARKIPLVVKGGWNTDFVKYQGIELAGKTAGIIGLGKNGKRIADLCSGLGMNVIAWDRKPAQNAIKIAKLEQVFSDADIIFPCLAENEETKKLITDELLKSMKTTAIFVGTIHFIYNHQLLLDMVKEGRLYGYGFESASANFMQYEGNVWAGPQIAWATDGSMRKNGEQWVEAIISAAKGEFPTRVN